MCCFTEEETVANTEVQFPAGISSQLEVEPKFPAAPPHYRSMLFLYSGQLPPEGTVSACCVSEVAQVPAVMVQQLKPVHLLIIPSPCQSGAGAR